MRVTCHIGHHKTGTTSLQAYLSQNAGMLLCHGILYPWVESQGAALTLAQMLPAQTNWRARARAVARDLTNRPPGTALPINFREAHNALAFRMLADGTGHWQVPGYHGDLPHSQQMLQALGHQIAATDPQDIVLCSEVMSHFGKAHPQLITDLRQALSAAQDFTLWCTLRRPDEQAASWHSQQIKFGHAPQPLSAAGGVNLGWLHFDYRGVIKPWLQRIPEARLMLRPYDRVMAGGGSVADLRRHSGIRFPRGLLPAPVMNVSLSPAVSALLREANRDLPRRLSNKLAREMLALAEGLDLPDPKDIELFGPENRARMHKAFAPVHDYLCDLAGGEGPFFADLDEMLVCRPVPEAQALRQLLDGLADRVPQLNPPELRDFLNARIASQGSRKATAGD